MVFMENNKKLNEEEVKREAQHACNIVQLSPYPYQAGGHNCVLVYDEKTICKPFDSQEHKVYCDFPHELRNFIPECMGVVEVQFVKSEDDVLCFALPLDCSYTRDRKRWENYLLTRNIQSTAKKHRHTSNGQCEQIRGKYLNIDDLKSLSQDCIVRRCRDSRFKELEKFLLLENIAHSFAFPCVLDLKMGTRCFGDHCSKAKRESKQRRARESTSASLGVRLGGMKVYNSTTNTFVFTDKYQGRSFTDLQLKQQIKRFFFDGVTHRTELFRPLINKLATLLELVEKIEACRFYCSSLLLLYDGKIPSDIVVKMIDFSHTRVRTEPTNRHVGPDRGYILGIRTLIDIISELGNEF